LAIAYDLKGKDPLSHNFRAAAVGGLIENQSVKEPKNKGLI